MNLVIEVTEGGVLKIKSPALQPGSEFVLPVETEEENGFVPSQWDALESALDDAEKLNIPRRTHQEILQQLRSYRD